ncbi:uncharacterized protein F4807DRAFT_382141 [Annulohypoxylon truncatum]|uniref:uncharacterized protein n=1 Tax=Annulohypoxylon truncatum TaxID=327061 RepID=UPI002007FBA5|nr:uncharacterized protein F4807DRAFT_382141 [Annulohypoxylon truncatum]KAI1211936.1 hypothetical protein F4807DRAFT_382141 [Annulohypoxylon truncatum]
MRVATRGGWVVVMALVHLAGRCFLEFVDLPTSDEGRRSPGAERARLGDFGSGWDRGYKAVRLIVYGTRFELERGLTTPGHSKSTRTELRRPEAQIT